MSQENVEVVLEAFRRFVPPDLSDWATLWHPEARSTPADGWPEPGPFVGRAAIGRQFERLTEDWSEHRFEDIEVVADSGDWVVINFRWETRGGASGLEARFDVAGAFRIDGGLITEAHFRWNPEDALEAAGVRSSGD